MMPVSIELNAYEVMVVAITASGWSSPMEDVIVAAIL